MKIILVVDNHDGVRRAIHHWVAVEFPPFRVIEASSAQDALTCARTQNPVLILMDIIFPEEKGMEVVRKMKALVPKVPIVILTFFDDENHRAEALQAGAAAFISKREMLEKLIPELSKHLSRVKLFA